METKNTKNATSPISSTLFLFVVSMFAFLFTPVCSFAEESRGLQTERVLHPGDIYTGDVLQKGEWFYAQPPFAAPGWFHWGMTDWCTLQFDVTAWLGGLPDMNVRVALPSPAPERVRLAWESMAYFFDANLDTLEDLADEDDHLFIRRDGWAGFSRLNVTVPMPADWIGHVSAGMSYSDELIIRNENRPDPIGKSFKKLWDPLFTLGIERRPSPKWTFHAGASYGETFTFQEARPRKLQATYGFRFAPFLKNRRPFWRNFRLEINAVMVYFGDADEGRSIPIPIIPYAYWQW